MAFSTRIEESLAAAGIKTGAECSPEKIQAQISQLMEEFQDEVQKTVSDLSYKTFGNFFVTAAALLSESMGGAAVAMIDHFVGSALLENTIGAISGAISMIFASIPGISFVMKYYAATTLKRDLIRRRDLAGILISELKVIRYWVKALAATSADYNKKYYANLVKSHQHVSAARRTLGVEAQKSQRKEGSVYIPNVTKTIKEIDLGISFLVPGFYEVSTRLQDLHTRYFLTTKMPSGTLLGGEVFTEYGTWIKYLKDITKEIKDKYKGNDNVLQSIIFQLVPIVPDFLKKLAINYVMSTSSKILIDRLPIWVLKNRTIKKYVTNMVTSTEIPDLFGVEEESRDYAMFSSADTKDITWHQIMEACKLDEAAFKLVPVYMNVMSTHNSMLQKIILPANDYLQKVDDDMDYVIANKNKDQAIKGSFITKKFEDWILKLEMSKNLLKTTIAGTGVYYTNDGQITNINTADITTAMAATDAANYNLDVFIANNTAPPGDQVITIANKYLLSLFAQSGVFIYNMVHTPGSAQSTLAALRSIEFLLNAQYEKDSEEIGLVTKFLLACESIPLFMIIKKKIDSLLNDLETGGRISRELVQQVRHGDLGNIAMYLDIASFATSTSCAVQKYISNDGNDETVLSRVSTTLSSVGIDQEAQIKIVNTIKGLKKKFKMLSEFSSVVNSNEEVYFEQ